MKKIIRYYISEIVSKSVANAQMFNWGEVLSANGVESIFVIFFRSKKKVNYMTQDSKQPMVKIPIVKFFIIRNLVHITVLLFLYSKARIKYHKIIFQTRTPSVAPSLAILRFFPGVKVITDVRGLEIEHYNIKSLISRLKLYSFDTYMWLSLYATDKIFCVSKPMVNIIGLRYRIKLSSKFTVIGGVADENYFYFDPELRTRIRKEYGIEERKVFIYSGMLDKPWQLPEKYFEFFEVILQKHKDFVLILLTPNTNLAIKLKEHYNIENNSIIIKESQFTDLVKYYNMADFGLLFRANKTLNKVASPTKFSEYALCGLPVIISDNIGDFSDEIKKSGFGYVINNTDMITQESSKIFDFISQFEKDRSEMATINKELYSKQSQLYKLLKNYNELFIN